MLSKLDLLNSQVARATGLEGTLSTITSVADTEHRAHHSAEKSSLSTLTLSSASASMRVRSSDAHQRATSSNVPSPPAMAQPVLCSTNEHSLVQSNESISSAVPRLSNPLLASVLSSSGSENSQPSFLEINNGENDIIIPIPGTKVKFYCRIPDFIVYAVTWLKGQPVRRMMCIVEVKPHPQTDSDSDHNELWKDVQDAFSEMERQVVEQVFFAFQQESDMHSVWHLSLIANWCQMRKYERKKFENGGYEAVREGRTYSKLASRKCKPYQFCKPDFTADYETRFKSDWTMALKEVEAGQVKPTRKDPPAARNVQWRT